MSHAALFSLLSCICVDIVDLLDMTCVLIATLRDIRELRVYVRHASWAPGYNACGNQSACDIEEVYNGYMDA